MEHSIDISLLQWYVKGKWNNFSKLATVEPAIKKVMDANSRAKQTEKGETSTSSTTIYYTNQLHVLHSWPEILII